METAHISKTKGKNNNMHTTESKVGTHLSNLIEISLERRSDISFHKPQKQAESEMIGIILIR